MEKKVKSPYRSAYKVGISVFVIIVVLLSLLISSITKSCNPVTNKKDNVINVSQIDTVYLPNPNAVKVVVHDTVFKTIPCNRKHLDMVKSTKDTSK